MTGYARRRATNSVMMGLALAGLLPAITALIRRNAPDAAIGRILARERPKPRIGGGRPKTFPDFTHGPRRAIFGPGKSIAPTAPRRRETVRRLWSRVIEEGVR